LVKAGRHPSFDAEIELFLGQEYEKHIITQATVLYIRREGEYKPLDIKRVRKLTTPINTACKFL
jgi:hypothetical protein